MEESKLGEFINEDEEILWAITVIETARGTRLRKCPAAAAQRGRGEGQPGVTPCWPGRAPARVRRCEEHVDDPELTPRNHPA